MLLNYTGIRLTGNEFIHSSVHSISVYVCYTLFYRSGSGGGALLCYTTQYSTGLTALLNCSRNAELWENWKIEGGPKGYEILLLLRIQLHPGCRHKSGNFNPLPRGFRV